MYLLAKFGGHKSYENLDINYINSDTDNLEKAKLTTSIHHIVRFLKSGKPTYNSKVTDPADRKNWGNNCYDLDDSDTLSENINTRTYT